MLTRADLKDYQLQGIEHIYALDRCGLWMRMGAGKTVTTLTALDDLSAVEDIWPALVVAPLRVARSVWPDEPAEWAHLAHLTVTPVLGDARAREKALEQESELYTINFDNLPWLREALGSRWPFRTVVVDEATRLAGLRTRQGSKRAAALRDVAHTSINRFIELTGTPAPNGLIKLWGQLWFLDHGERLGKTYTAFEERWFTKGWDGYSTVPLPHSEKEIHDRIDDICLTIEGDPVDEPVVIPVPVELPQAARKLYRDMEKELFMEVEGHEVEAFNAATKTNKCLQMANGAAYVDEGAVDFVEVHRAKLEALESLIEEANGSPVLVAYNFRSDLLRLKQHFPGGKVLDTEGKVIKEWNAGRVPLLFAHPKCLHPSTEVLTEYRGWVKIVEVRADERVFDGAEFVAHRGCSFSGVMPVVECFGLLMTPDHRLLIGERWERAADVRDREDLRAQARYVYPGSDSRLGALLSVRCRTRDAEAERGPGQRDLAGTLPGVPQGFVSLHDAHEVLVDLERHEGARNQPWQPGFCSLWRGRAWHLPGVAGLQEFLRRHVSDLPGWADHRARGQQPWLLQGELSLGDECRTTDQQVQQPGTRLPRAPDASGRVLPHSGRGPGRDKRAAEFGNDTGRGFGRLHEVKVSEEQEVQASPVYDLVDCGPRNRFVVRNAAGEVFVSHNSAGHGLNLAKGGNILVFFGLDWDLEAHEQIIERIGPRRQKAAGLDRPTYVYLLQAKDTIDEVVIERLRTKSTVQEALMRAMARRKT